MTAVPSGWGGAPWGSGPWGVGAPPLLLLSALAVRENVVRATFSDVPLIEGLETPSDASSPKRYQVVAVSGIGLDGLPVRPVLPVSASVADVPGAAGTSLDIVVDRPFSPWPCVYRLAVTNLVSKGGAFLAPGASQEFFGARAGIVPPTMQATVASVDVLTAAGARDLAGVAGARGDADLGIFVPDATGDYASAPPLSSFRSRVYRRLLAVVGSFAHLPRSYGAGLSAAPKQPGRATVLERLAALAEEQIRLEPETVDVRVTVTDQGGTGAFLFRVQLKAKFGREEFDVPVRRAA